MGLNLSFKIGWRKYSGEVENGSKQQNTRKYRWLKRRSVELKCEYGVDVKYLRCMF